ncbi:histidine kinase [Enterococcus florum]|uniref:histidine kinase n=1 Tax=Enterococcus florum TaxID=2480627 RepID=A0A4P5PBK0_9ENTE|nr:sensor histidine kinase [Enterococcus florum]GCF95547.1 histidine kinase [Enterococcus florum]
MKRIKGFLWEQRVLYLMYLILMGLFLFTFYLYDFPLLAFWDSILFTFFALLVYSIIGCYRYYRKQLQLQLFSRQVLQSSIQTLLPKPSTQAEKSYQHMLDQLIKEKGYYISQANQDKQEVFEDFGMWMHQIKTPVAALDLMIQSGDSSPGLMKAELFKINEYLQMMLNYLRQNLDHQDMVIENVSLDMLVKKVLKKYAFFFSQKNLQLELKELDGMVYTDQKWAGFILEQLLFNAIKYTREGKITIAFSENQLTIQDTGIGIRAEDLPRVFEKGYTGYNGRKEQRASGLGLYLSRLVAQKIGCRLAIESKIGIGTTVMMFFPKEYSGFD